MQTILVHMANLKWTTQALHLACALARNDQARVVLLRLIEVQHVRTLGTDYANVPFTPQEYTNLVEYNATAEDYGVDISVAQIQCAYPLEAVINAAQQLNADMVFVHVPDSRIPLLKKLRLWQLERMFAKTQRQFYTLETPHNTIIQPAQSPAVAATETRDSSPTGEALSLDRL